MNEKDLIEKFIADEQLSDDEREQLIVILQNNYELTEELQQNLYIDELMDQLLYKKKSDEAFMAELNMRISQKSKRSKKRRFTQEVKRKPTRKQTHKKGLPAMLFVAAMAFCFILGIGVVYYMIQVDGQSKVAPHGTNLYVQDVKGHITVKRDGGNFKLTNGAYISDGDIVETSSQSSCTFYFIKEKTSIKLKPDSELKIKSGVSNPKDKYVNLIKGSAAFDVAKQAAEGSFYIETDKSISKIIGTRLDVSQDEVRVHEGLVRIECLESNETIDCPGNHFVKFKDLAYPNLRSISGKRPQVLSFSLVDASSDKVVQNYLRLQNGVILGKSALPKSISIRINVSNAKQIAYVKSVLKDEEGNELFSMKEGFIPYSMTGDKTEYNDYEEWVPTAGRYHLEVSIVNQQNKEVDSSSLVFTVN